MKPQVALRPATQADATLFYAVIDKTMRSFIVATWGAWDEARVCRESKDDSASPNARVVQVEGQDVGVLLVEEEPTHLQVRQVYLLPKYQRQGIGSQLVALVVKRSAASAKPVRLSVLRANPARQFYEKLGFEVTNEDNDFFHMERAA